MVVGFTVWSLGRPVQSTGLAGFSKDDSCCQAARQDAQALAIFRPHSKTFSTNMTSTRSYSNHSDAEPCVWNLTGFGKTGSLPKEPVPQLLLP